MAEAKAVLVVDDEPSVTRSCMRILSEEGYRVLTTESGKEGLCLARIPDYDLLLTDLKMPDLGGMTIVETLKQERVDIPVVVITGYGTPETQARVRELGVAGYIEKPFTPEQIAEAVSSAFAQVERKAAVDDPIRADVRQLAAKYERDESALIQMLLDVQQARGYLSKEWLFGISAELDIPLNRVYQAATFYKAFSLEPRGKHIVQVCTGTACHVRGAPTMVSRMSDALGVRPGKTTTDGLFTLETVNCLGCCALGPVLAVDGKYYSNPSPDDVEEILNAHRQERE